MSGSDERKQQQFSTATWRGYLVFSDCNLFLSWLLRFLLIVQILFIIVRLHDMQFTRFRPCQNVRYFFSVQASAPPEMPPVLMLSNDACPFLKSQFDFITAKIFVVNVVSVLIPLGISNIPLSKQSSNSRKSTKSANNASSTQPFRCFEYALVSGFLP